MFFHSLFALSFGTVHLHHVSLIIHPSNRAERERIEMPTKKRMKICRPRLQLLKKEVKTYLSTHSSVFISSIAEALISSIEGQDASQLLKSEGLEGFLEFLDLFCFLPFLEGFEGFLFFSDFLDSLVFFI